MRLCAAACLLAMLVPVDLTQAQDADPARVETALIALREQLAFPGDTTEQAARNLRTPDRALEFVKNEIVYLGYPGAFAGPGAMLRTRVGNCTDKARLLQEILKQQGYET